MMNFQFLNLLIAGICTVITSNENGPLEIDGDIILGGLFPVHLKSDENENICGVFDEVPGYQYMEGMLFAIEQVNSDPDLLPSITLGARVHDTCGSKTIAANAAKQFIKMTVVKDTKIQLAGVVGSSGSDVSQTVANFLRVFEIPQISYDSTSISLSNKDIYSYFLRTVPPDSFQAQAIADIIKEFGWNYVSTINTFGAYGTKGMEEFWKAAEQNGICIDVKVRMEAYPAEQEYEETIKRIYNRAVYSKVSVIVIFGTQNVIRRLVEAALKHNSLAPRRFTWIGSDGWSNRLDFVGDAAKPVLGALTIMMRKGDISQKFKDHYTSFNVTNYPRKNKRYFQEFWENRFRCRLGGMETSKYQTFKNNCHGNESLKSIDTQYSSVRTVINAVYAFAHALDSLQKELCKGQFGLCPEMGRFKRLRLLEHLKNVSFWDPSANATIKFDQNYEVSAMYDIMNYRSEDGVNKYVRVGTWDGEKTHSGIKSRLVLEKNIQWLQGVPRPPTSYCSEKCADREIQVPIPTFDFTCCWQCNRCHKLQIVQNKTCLEGPDGWIPNANQTGWIKRELVYPKWDDSLSIAIIASSFVSLLLTLCTFVFYHVHKQNRLLKASGRELCFVMLSGIALCFTVPVLFIAKPGPYVCYARNLVSSMSLVMCYAPLFMKVNRIYRIFTHARTSVTRPSFVSPRMQLLITFALICIQILFNTLMFIANPVSARETYYSAREELLFECYMDDIGFIVNLSYVMLLMFLCTAYAFKTRNFPRNYNESKYIGITMYITCAVWTVFFPLFLNTSHSVQHVYLTAGAYIIIGLVTLIGQFGQKVFIVFWVKEASNENLTLSTRSLSLHRRVTLTQQQEVNQM